MALFLIRTASTKVEMVPVVLHDRDGTTRWLDLPAKRATGAEKKAQGHSLLAAIRLAGLSGQRIEGWEVQRAA